MSEVNDYLTRKTLEAIAFLNAEDLKCISQRLQSFITEAEIPLVLVKQVEADCKLLIENLPNLKQYYNPQIKELQIIQTFLKAITAKKNMQYLFSQERFRNLADLLTDANNAVNEMLEIVPKELSIEEADNRTLQQKIINPNQSMYSDKLSFSMTREVNHRKDKPLSSSWQALSQKVTDDYNANTSDDYNSSMDILFLQSVSKLRQKEVSLNQSRKNIKQLSLVEPKPRETLRQKRIRDLLDKASQSVTKS